MGYDCRCTSGRPDCDHHPPGQLRYRGAAPRAQGAPAAFTSGSVTRTKRVTHSTQACFPAAWPLHGDNPRCRFSPREAKEGNEPHSTAAVVVTAGRTSGENAGSRESQR